MRMCINVRVCVWVCVGMLVLPLRYVFVGVLLVMHSFRVR